MSRLKVSAGRSVAALRRTMGARSSLRVAEGAFRRLAEGSLEGIWIHRNNRILFCNQSLAQMFGFDSPKDVRARLRVSDMIDPEDRERLWSYYAMRMRGDPAPTRYQFRARRQDGTTFWIDAMVGATLWGDRPAVQATGIDITEQKRAEEALRESESRLRLLTNAVPVSFAYIDSDLRYRFCNELLGRWLACAPEDLVGRKVADVLPAGSMEQVRPYLLRALSGERVDWESAVSLPDGKTRRVRVVYIPDKAPNGEVRGICAMGEDNTERHLADEKLRASQGLLQAVMDQVPMGVSVKGRDGRYLVVNSELARTLGTQPSALVGLTTEELPNLDPTLKAATLDMDSRVLQSGRGVDSPELCVTRPPGESAWYHLVRVPLRDNEGQLMGIIGVAEDITRRKQAERELTQMATALEQAGDAVFITDLQGGIRYVNTAFERLTGYQRDEVIGCTPRILKSGVHPPEFYRAIWHSLKVGEVWEGRYLNRRKDGTLYHTHSTHSPIRDRDGRVDGYLAVQRDITEQIRMEEHLRRTQRMEALGTLAGGIAHDFNNLLMPIMGYAEMLSRQVADGSESRTWAQNILGASNRARDLIAQILLFSRKSQGSRVPMRLDLVIREVVDLLRATVPPSLRMSESIECDGWMLGDSAQMSQVLMNLCVNAIQAMPTGGQLGISLAEVRQAPMDAYLGHRLRGPQLRLVVTDSGQGMDAETRSHLFEPFFSTKPVGKGTGLGLATVFGIVEAHGGGIRVESAPGEGSRFELYLPMESARPGAPQRKPVATSSGGERVLVVDDEPVVAELIQLSLTEEGYRVTAVSSSLKARELLAADPAAFDAVITDQTMPGLTGFELAQWLRERNGTVRIVLCTGYDAGLLAEDAGKGVFDTLLNKPIGPSDLAAELRRLLSQRR